MSYIPSVFPPRGEPDTTVFGPTTVYVYGIGPYTNWKIDRSDPSSFAKIVDVLPTGVCTLWMPIPTESNAVIAYCSNPFITLCVATQPRIFINRHCPADGVEIPRGDAFGITSADCPTIVVYDKRSEMVTAAHAVRDSILDKKLILTGKSSRCSLGIVNVALEDMSALRNSIPQNMVIGVFGGIRKNFCHNPQHKKYGAYNRKLIEFCKKFDGAVVDEHTGEIDLYNVIRGIAIQKGVLDNNIYFDSIDTGSDVGKDGQPFWASHRLGEVNKRNFVLVHHHGNVHNLS